MTGLPGQTIFRGYAAAVRLLLHIRSIKQKLYESEDRI